MLYNTMQAVKGTNNNLLLFDEWNVLQISPSEIYTVIRDIDAHLPFTMYFIKCTGRDSLPWKHSFILF